MQEHNISLADFVLESGKKSQSKPLKEALWIIGRELAPGSKKHPSIKRFSYDQSVDKIMGTLRDIPFEDFTAQFKFFLMPFDAFWIENKPLPVEDQRPAEIQRKGFYVKRDLSNGDIVVRYVCEHTLADEKTVLPGTRATPKQWMAAIGFHIKNDRFITADNLEIAFNENGFTVRDDKSINTAMMRKNSDPEKQAESRELDANIAKDVIRILVLLSSSNVQSNFADKRQTNGPIVSAAKDCADELANEGMRTIRIDLAPKLAKALLDRDHEQAKKLLGWTDVRRHRRTYHTKNGPEIRVIEPYERRIERNVDNRGAPRELTSSVGGLHVEISPDRPPEIVKASQLPQVNRKPH